MGLEIKNKLKPVWVKAKWLIFSEDGGKKFYHYGLLTYLALGIVLLFIVLFILFTKGMIYNLFSALCLLLASQIAGFAVIRTIINTNEVERLKNEKEKLKAEKVLTSYFKHLYELGEKQITFADEAIKAIPLLQNPTISIEELTEYFYTDEINVLTYLKPIDEMLNHDLHKYTDEDMLDFILKIKVITLENMHYTKLIKNDYIKYKKIKELRETLNLMKNNTRQLLEEGQKYVKMVEKSETP